MNTHISPKLDKQLLDMGIDMPVSPTISDVVMWLYEKHGIWIDVNITRYGKFWGNVFLKEEYNDLKNPFNWEFVNQIIDFNSPTEAYEAAIEYTLNNLI